MTKKILIVDDDEMLLKSLVKLLSGEGFTVLSSPSFDNAINLAETDSAIQVFFLDLLLRDDTGKVPRDESNGVKCGVVLAKRLRIICPKGVIYAVTGHGMHGAVNEEFFDKIFLKPVEGEKLIAAAHQAFTNLELAI